MAITSPWINGINYYVKPVSEQVADLERALAEAKAKLAAEEKAKVKTYGERVAEKMVSDNGQYVSVVAADQSVGYASVKTAFGDPVMQANLAHRIEGGIAAALDKAYADGAAEQREKDAKFCDDRAAAHARCDSSMGVGIYSAYCTASEHIRHNK